MAIGVCNSPQHGHYVTPWGGREGRLATNPLSFAVPANSGHPIVADFSTAAASEGAIRLHRNMGKPLPDGCIMDADGRPTNDPAAFYGPPQGAINPLGGRLGYRGFALSLLVEVLGGLLGGSPVSKKQPGNGLGFVLIDVSAFVPPDQFGEMVHELKTYIKSAALAPGYLETIDLPLVLMSATEDQLIDIRSHQPIVARLKQGEHVVVAGAKHEIMMEIDPLRAQLWQAFDRLAARFDR